MKLTKSPERQNLISWFDCFRIIKFLSHTLNVCLEWSHLMISNIESCSTQRRLRLNMKEALLLWKQRRDQLSNIQSTLIEKCERLDSDKNNRRRSWGNFVEKKGLTFNKFITPSCHCSSRRLKHEMTRSVIIPPGWDFCPHQVTPPIRHASYWQDLAPIYFRWWI